jgi:hypothetical protein
MTFHGPALPDGSSLLRLDDIEMPRVLDQHGDGARARLRDAVLASLRDWPRSGCVWYLRRPWLPRVLDATLRHALSEAMKHERLDALIDTEDLRQSWVPRRLAERQIVERHTERIWDLERLPRSFDDALLERARMSRDQDELERLAARFAGDEQAKAQLLDALRAHVVAAAEPSMVQLLARHLVTPSAWRTHGPPVVAALIERAPLLLWWLVMGMVDPKSLPEAMKEKLRPLVPAVHLAFAQGILLFVDQRGKTLGQAGLQRALAAIGLLDPPRHFTKDIHRFKQAHRHEPVVSAISDLIHGIADGGRPEPSLSGVLQCIRELKALGPSHPA